MVLRPRYTDFALGAGILGILTVLLVPLPAVLMDFLITINFTLSLLLLLVSMYISRPPDFSVFPSLLLISTLYRLTLNVAATRLILLHGGDGPEAAGRVIQGFGEFVVGGNFVVGIVVFLILVVIQFVVITKGAGRIAEVAARFTLDAMPGKQMAIDADLNAGLIAEHEARRRRTEVAREGDFYGAMDGASKFVRGDAVAGLIITVVNILGGLAIGVLQDGLPIEEALATYTILTVGDGLVAQIPALIISTAAGIVVSRAASESELSQELMGQLTLRPRPLGVAAGILGVLALLPGLPLLPFLGPAAVLALGAYQFRARRRRPRDRGSRRAPPSRRRPRRSRSSWRSIRCRSSWAMACCPSSTRRPRTAAISSRGSARCAGSSPSSSASSSRPSACATAGSSAPTSTSSASAMARWRAARCTPTGSSP